MCSITNLQRTWFYVITCKQCSISNILGVISLQWLTLPWLVSVYNKIYICINWTLASELQKLQRTSIRTPYTYVYFFFIWVDCPV
jgi:hypothetical protein